MLGPFPLTLSESPAGNDWFSRLHLCHHHAQPPRADVCPGPSPRLPHRARRPGPDVRGPTGSWGNRPLHVRSTPMPVYSHLASHFDTCWWGNIALCTHCFGAFKVKSSRQMTGMDPLSRKRQRHYKKLFFLCQYFGLCETGGLHLWCVFSKERSCLLYKVQFDHSMISCCYLCFIFIFLSKFFFTWPCDVNTCLA